MDELAAHVQVEILRRKIITRGELQRRGLLLPEPPRIITPTNEAELAAREAEDAKRELVQAVFRGVRFSSKEKNPPCPAGELPREAACLSTAADPSSNQHSSQTTRGTASYRSSRAPECTRSWKGRVARHLGCSPAGHVRQPCAQ